MWKRMDSDSETQPESTPHSSSFEERRPQPVREKAIIGPSLVVKGDVSGDEDVTIQGKVEGKVILKNNSITVGKNGRVKADLYGKMIAVEGNVTGNLFGEEQIVVRQTGTVRGNLVAPRVTIEDGAKFKGSIDMEGADASNRSSEAAPTIVKNHRENSAEKQPERKKAESDQPSLGLKNPSPSK